MIAEPLTQQTSVSKPRQLWDLRTSILRASLSYYWIIYHLLCRKLRRKGRWFHYLRNSCEIIEEPCSSLFHYKFTLETSSKLFGHLSRRQQPHITEATHHRGEMKTDMEHRQVWSGRYKVLWKAWGRRRFGLYPCLAQGLSDIGNLKHCQHID